MLWWTGPHWLSQEPSSWPTTEVKAPTDKPNITNVHVALLCAQEGITHIFQAQQTHSSHCILQKNSSTAGHPMPTGNQPLSPYNILRRL